MRLPAILLIGLLTTACGSVASRSRLNLTGSWSIDKSATHLQLLNIANLERGTLTIEHTDATLHFTRIFVMGGRENAFSFELPLDGKEVVTESDGQTRYSRLYWEDGALVYFTRIVAPGGESTNVVHYRLSVDGNTLEAHEERRGADSYDNLWVFRRQP